MAANVTSACKDINELAPVARKACKLFLDKCEEAGLKVLVTETYRPQARQDYLYAQGRTRPGNIVTWTKSSNHTGRMAWDICQNIKGQEYSNKQFFIRCGDIAKKLGITWGGDWKTPDTPHFQVEEGWSYSVELTTVNDIIYRLGKEAIITDKDYWLKRATDDSNIYWLLRKMANYTLQN